MSLPPGTALGPYEIAGLIGAGGMGEVYRARDPRLNRDVAVKILPPGLATDPERQRRFEQEARAAAALEHPGILAIYDVGQHAISPRPGADPELTPYIVSELLKGATLRDLITARPRTATRKAVDYAVQTARALAAAHEKGIVHRDLKPENVFVTSDDRVKILDFGLAKLTEAAQGSDGPLTTATAAATPNTTPGVVLGTVGYMSPEQVRGLPADHRSDIFALGAMLYEMLSGQRAFRGETPADTMGAILSVHPPELDGEHGQVSPTLARIVHRCLEKAATVRFQTASDLAFALEALSEPSGALVRPPGASATMPRWPWTIAAAAILAALGGLAGLFWRPEPEPVVSRRVHSTISVPTAVGSGDALPLALSPDGGRLAFVAPDAGGRFMLWIRPIDALTAQPLAGTEGAAAPFWSADSRSVAFVSGGRLLRVDASGGAVSTLAEGVDAVPGTWSADDVILFKSVTAPSLMRVEASGAGVPSPATRLDLEGTENAHGFPVFLPDGQRFLYVARHSDQGQRADLYVGSLDSPDRRLLMEGVTNVQYANGALLFLRGTTLMARALDAGTLDAGSPVVVAEGVSLMNTSFTNLGLAVGAFSASQTGEVVYLSTSTAGSQLVWFDSEGTPLGVLGDPAPYADVFVSHDGRWASASIPTPGGTTTDIWTFDVERNVSTRFTSDPGNEFEGVWSRDGSRVAFNSDRNGQLDLYARDGSGANEVLLYEDGLNKYAQDWAPDDESLLYLSTSLDSTKQDLWILPLAGDGAPRPVCRTAEYTEGVGAAFSPDGRSIAFTSDESGAQEVYVTPSEGPCSKVRVSISGGLLPRWRGNGEQLFYFEASNGRMMAAEVSGSGRTFSVGAVRPLFPVLLAGPRAFYHVAGTEEPRFLVNTALGQSEETPVRLITNWPSLLRQ
jgi:Tol biopolymer transport system component